MTDERWLFIGTDQRMSACSRIMADRGYACLYMGTDSYTADVGKMIDQFKPRHIVFPVLQLSNNMPTELLERETTLYVGRTSENWRAPLEKLEFKIHPYLEDEQFIWRNARLTAEAFVKEYHSRAKQTISDAHFYVAGFGKVGKMIAHVFSSLGAEVTILARSAQQLGEALAYRYQVHPLTKGFVLEEGCLINTIPAKWLSVPNDTKLHIFDLASAPGCLTTVTAPEYYIILPGLPGKHFPTDAAAALADALERIYRK